jgi:fatty acid desaturase
VTEPCTMSLAPTGSVNNRSAVAPEEHSMAHGDDRPERQPDRRRRRALAGIMAAVAALLVLVGLVLAAWGSAEIRVIGWVMIGWGFGGLGSATLTLIRAQRR